MLRVMLLALITALIALPGISPRALRADTSPIETGYRLQQRYHQITSLSFNFTQKTSGQMSGRPKTGSGTGIFYKSPNKTMMRWNYNAPEHQVVLSDGQTVTMYFEALNQMIVSSAEAAQADVLFTFFTGNGALEDNFIVLAPEPDMAIPDNANPDNLIVLQLVPRQQDSQIRSIHLYISQDSLIKRVELLDYFDTRTVITLSGIQIDPLAGKDEATIDQVFAFTPPPGTEIIHQ